MSQALPVILILGNDQDLAASLDLAVTAAGAQLVVVSDVSALWEAIGHWPELVVIDLGSVMDQPWDDIVRRAKNLPHTRAIPIVAVDARDATEALKTARALGCNHTWSRSQLAAEWPNLLESTLRPPTRWVAGWNEPRPALLLKGIEQFNAGEYWECHETLEGLWRSEQRPISQLYQGILQIGVAFHHMRHHNYAGAIKMLRRGLPRLRGLPAECQGVRIAELAWAARCVYDRLSALGPEHLDDFDLDTLPRIAMSTA